jgi:metal-dependent hydrolase (beta-lactamase superfamily II)
MKPPFVDGNDVVISHNHDDHTDRLVTLRRELNKEKARAISRAHVSANIFLPRLKADGSDDNGLTLTLIQVELSSIRRRF